MILDKPKIALVRGRFLNRYEMQMYEPLASKFQITAFGSFSSFHKKFSFPTILLPSPVDITDFPYKMPILNRIFRDAHLLAGLENRLSGFDIAHTAETYFYYTHQALTAKKRGLVRKVITTVLENIAFNNEGIRGRKQLKKSAIDQVDRFVCVSSLAAQALVSEGADSRKISLVSYHIDTDRFKPDQAIQKQLQDPDRRDFNILFVGRLEWSKGVFDIVRAAGVLAGDRELSGFRLKFIFCGNGSGRSELISLLCRLGLSDRSRIIIRDYNRMPQVYKSAHIFLAPSRPMSHWQEQFNIALLEAQSSGLPIITTNTGSIPENIGPAGIIINPGDIENLAKSMKKYLTDSLFRFQMAQEARQRALKLYSLKYGVKKLSEIYNQVLAER